MQRIPDSRRSLGGADDVAADVADLVHRVSRRIRTLAHEDLGPLGLTPAHARALRTLARAGSPVRMSTLADRLGIVRRSATSVVDDLVRRGHLARRTDAADRRAVLVELTPSGRDLVAELQAGRRNVARRLTRGMSPADLDALRALLRQLDS